MLISRISKTTIFLGLFLIILNYLSLGQGVYHTVRKGENLYRIAKAYGVAVDKLMDANFLRDPNKIIAGQDLLIPGARSSIDELLTPEPTEVGVYHTVRKGENLYRIAKAYGVPVDKLMDANFLRDPNKIIAGQDLLIPEEYDFQRFEPGSSPASEREDFIWPLKGKVVSKFEVRNGVPYEGIAIAVSKEEVVKAAMSGVVLYSDNGQSGYGNMVIISHGGNVFTVYANNSSNLVREGDQVRRGQAIARVGSRNGDSTLALHFEIRINRKAVDPLELLPGGAKM